MIETFEPKLTQPGAMVHVDPRLEALLAINLLDEEPETAPLLLEPRRFHRAIAGTEERIPVLAR